MPVPVQSELEPMGKYFLIRALHIDVDGVRLDKVINEVKSSIESIKTDYYTKQQADDKFTAKTDVYTKSEVDTALNGKVSVQSGYGLISDAEKAQIQTNKSGIAAAETAIAGKASTEAVAQLQTDMAVQEARMDQLVGTVPAGSADEIADARVTADGKTEANLGNAIRSQFSGLKETIDTIRSVTRNVLSVNNIETDGASDFIQIDTIQAGRYIVNASFISSTDTDSALCRIYFFDSEKTSIIHANMPRGNDVTNTVNVEFDRDVQYIRFYPSNSHGTSVGDHAVFKNVMVRSVTEENGEYISHFTANDVALREIVSAMSNYVSDLKNDLKDVSEITRNLLSFNSIQIYESSDYIPIDKIESGEYIVTADEITSTDTDSSISRIYYFDTNKNSVGYTNMLRGTNLVNTVNTVLSGDAYYIRFYASSQLVTSAGDTASFTNVMLRNLDEVNSKFIPHESATDFAVRERIGGNTFSHYSLSKMYRMLKIHTPFAEFDMQGLTYYNGNYYLCGHSNNANGIVAKLSDLNHLENATVVEHGMGHANDCTVCDGKLYVTDGANTIYVFDADTLSYIREISIEVNANSIDYADGYFYIRHGFRIFKYKLVDDILVSEGLYYRLSTPDSIFKKYGYTNVVGQGMTVSNGVIYISYMVYNSISEINKLFIVTVTNGAEDAILLDILNGDEPECICIVNNRMYSLTITSNWICINEYIKNYSGDLRYNAITSGQDINHIFGIGKWSAKNIAVENVPISDVDFLLTNSQTPFGILQVFECYQNGYVCKKRIVKDSLTEWTD